MVLEHDVSDRDRYDGLLKYVYLSDGTRVNGVLIEEGYAKATICESDDRCEDALYGLEGRAKTNRLGGWAACGWN